MKPTEFVAALVVPKQAADRRDQENTIKALVQFYCTYLAEDPIEGSKFDCEVISRLENLLKQKPEAPNIHWPNMAAR